MPPFRWAGAPPGGRVTTGRPPGQGHCPVFRFLYQSDVLVLGIVADVIGLFRLRLQTEP